MKQNVQLYILFNNNTNIVHIYRGRYIDHICTQKDGMEFIISYLEINHV